MNMEMLRQMLRKLETGIELDLVLLKNRVKELEAKVEQLLTDKETNK